MQRYVMKRFSAHLFFFFTFLLFSCSTNSDKQPAGEVQGTEDSLQTTPSEFTCPMHPEVVSDKAGTCSKCGMELQVKS